jgi:hypothetical protein
MEKGMVLSCHRAGGPNATGDRSLALRDSEHSCVVVHRYTGDLPVDPAQKSFNFIEVQNLENFKVWTAYTTSALYGWYPGSCSWLCSDIGLTLPSPGVIVAFSIVLYCNWYAAIWFVYSSRWSCYKWYQNIITIKGFKRKKVQMFIQLKCPGAALLQYHSCFSSSLKLLSQSHQWVFLILW